MFNVGCFYLYIYRDAHHWKKKAFCVLEYARSQSSNTVQHAFVSEFSKQSQTAM